MSECEQKNIMLVDDDEFTNYVNQRFLEISGCGQKISSFISPSKALEYLKHNSNFPENLPDLILLDLQMPRMDGFQFLKTFEEFSEIIKRKCMIIILSSSDSKEDLQKIKENKYVLSFFEKPLRKEHIELIKKSKPV
jgi:CheY-like chemotaxis protein